MELKDEEILRAMIGKNADHYLEKFKQLERGEKPKYQWSAFLIGPLFLLYRKCYDVFAKYLAAPLGLMMAAVIMSGIGSGLLFSNAGISAALLMIAGVLSAVANIWAIVVAILLGRKFPKLYFEHLTALKDREQIYDVEHSQATIKQFATSDVRIPIAFIGGYIVIISIFSMVLPGVLLNRSLSIEPDISMTDTFLTEPATEKDTELKTGGLLDLSMDELYLQMLDKSWVNETTGDTLYIETGGISATDGLVYENGAYIGSYSAYGVYGSENPNGAVPEEGFQLEIWLEDGTNIGSLYEVRAADAERLRIYDTVTGVSCQYSCVDESSGVSTANQSTQAAQEMTLEEAREYLIQSMYEVHPDFDAREDLAYSLQSENEDYYYFQVLAKNVNTTSNNMGFYSVFKHSGEVYDDIFGELIWTPYDGLIR